MLNGWKTKDGGCNLDEGGDYGTERVQNRMNLMILTTYHRPVEIFVL